MIFLCSVVQLANKEIKAGDEISMNYRIFRADMTKHPSFEDFLTNHVCDPSKEGLVVLDDQAPVEVLQTR